MLAAALAVAPLPARSLLETVTTSERRDQQREGRVMVDLMQNLHYSARQFREIDSGEMIDAYLDHLDPENAIFTQPDVDRFHQRFERTLKSVYLVHGDDAPALEIADVFRAGVARQVEWARARLDRGFDFDVAETALPDDAPRARDAKELEMQWEKRLKEAVLLERLAGRTADEAIANVRKRFNQWGQDAAALTVTKARELFWESEINLFDPHSGYFAADSARDFKVMMSGSVSGVGLVVHMRDGLVSVASILPGGPADQIGSIQPGDEVVALAAGDAPQVPTRGLALNDIVERLRGAPGTALHVAFRPAAAAPVQEITLVRQDVVLAELRARGGLAAVDTDEGPIKVGWIELPEFYGATGDDTNTSAAQDMAELLGELQKRGAQAIVVDLRSNPGGGMSEAVAVASLFLPSGLVVATRDMEGKLELKNVSPHEPPYAGPLVVLTSARSASASEIFAGAMQFHRRAVIVGGSRTYGKGTAQAYLDLNHSPLRGTATGTWGMLRVTSERFYFPDGRSPQGAGAKSDVVLSMLEDPADKFEESERHALSQDTLALGRTEPATGAFRAVTSELLRQLGIKMQQRMSTLPEFKLAGRRQALAADLKKSSTSLRLADRIQELETFDAARETLRHELLALPPTFHPTLVDIALVRETRARHSQWVRARKPENADPKVGWMDRGTFCFDDESGELREIPLGSLPFREHVRSSAALAERFRSASGGPLTDAQMAEILRRLATMEQSTERQVEASFATAAPAGEPAAQRGISAVLRALADEDVTVRPPTVYDIGLRESLRIAADCAAPVSSAKP